MKKQDLPMDTLFGKSKPLIPSLKKMGWLTHLVAWGILFCAPFFFTASHSEQVTFLGYLRFIIFPFSFIILFYVNYLYLVKKYIFRKKFLRFIFINLLIIAGLMVGVHVLMHTLPVPENFPPRPEHSRIDVARFFIGNTMVYLLVAGLSVAIKMTASWYQAESAQKELEKSRSEAELQNLKSQLNPHFLFNTLNNIYSLISISPEKAQNSVHDLSNLLRYVLYESSHPYVPLEKEIDFIQHYIDLMRIRLSEKVKIDIHVSPLLKTDTLIAPLLFISLVENAFKHGTSNQHPSFISIDISQDEEKITCRIRNSYFPKNTERDKSGSGIGLINLQKRLNLLYGEKAHFTCGQEGNTYFTNLSILI